MVECLKISRAPCLGAAAENRRSVPCNRSFSPLPTSSTTSTPGPSFSACCWPPWWAARWAPSGAARPGRRAANPYSGLPGSHHDGHGGPLHRIHSGLLNDPLRVSAQVISGIGFLGAGTILTRNHSQVTGLTTAAGLWTTASIGLAIGIGFYWAVVVSFIIVMITISIPPGWSGPPRAGTSRPATWS